MKNDIKLTKKLTSILVILLIAVVAYGLVTIQNIQIENNASADEIGLNGVVEDGYVSSYRNISGATAIGDETTLKDWLSSAGTSESPKYGYLTQSFSFTSHTYEAAIKYHYLDGCGYTITITSAGGSVTGGNSGTEDPIIAEDATYSNSTLNFLDSSNNKTYGDEASIITTYGSRATPFGLDSDAYGFHTAGYLGSIYAFSSLNNLNVVFNGTFAYKDTSTSRGLSFGIMFGYLYGSYIDNCSLTMNGQAAIYYGSSKNGADIEGVCTVCMGGYAGTIDNSSSLSNSKITLSAGSMITGFSVGNTWGLFDRNYPRVFIGGVAGCLLSSDITNVTASGSGNLRAWGGTPTQDSGKNRMGLAGIIVGCNVSAGPAGSVYTPENIGSNESGSSTATAGNINGVICSWTGIAMFYIGSSQWICGSSKSDTFYHGTSIGGSTGVNVCEYFYGGMICPAAATGTVTGVFYTFNKDTLFDVAYDTYRYIRSDKATGGDGYGVSTSSNSVGVQPVLFSENIPSGNYLVLQIQEPDGTYVQTTGTYSRATFSGGSSTITLNEKTYYSDSTFVSQGSISDIQTDVFGLEWANTTDSANVVAKADATKISGYTATSGLFVWAIEVLNSSNATVANKQCYTYATSMEDALTNYKQYEYTDSIMARSSSNASYTIKASTGYAGTYILNGDNIASSTGSTWSLGLKTYDQVVGLTTPTVQLYTLNGSNIVPMNFLNSGSTSGITVGATTTYQNSDIWAIYQEGDMTMHGFDVIQNAGTYTLRVNRGITSQSNAEFKYDILDTTNRIVCYKVDNIHYDTSNPSSFWQPTYTYTINAKQITGAWKNLSNTVDSINYTTPSDFTYIGSTLNFAYEYASGAVGSDSPSIPMTYELITYSKLSSANLERNNTYYLLSDDVYYEFGKYQISGDEKYFLCAIPSQTYYKFTAVADENLSGSTTYYYLSNGVFKSITFDSEMTEKEDGVTYYSITSCTVGELEIDVEYYELNAGNYVKYGTYVEVDATNYFKRSVGSSIYYKRVYKTTADVKNAGSYRITVNDCDSINYMIDPTLQREWFVTVSPRTFKIEYQGMDDLIYNAQTQKITWAIADNTKTVLARSGEGITASNANVLAYYVFDAAALDFTYDDNSREYTTAGEYYLTISLASGEVANNYVLPTTIADITSVESETIFDVTRIDEVEGNVVGVTRIVTINKATVGLLRQYNVSNLSDAAFIDAEYGTAYNYYSEITNPVYATTTITFEGVDYTDVYYESENYKGYNTLPCVIKGVNDEDYATTKHFDLVYCDPIYYPAELVGGKYVIKAGSTSVSVITAKGIYIAKISFDADAYINYAIQDFFVVYEVNGVFATITATEAAANLDDSFEYDAQEHTAEYTGFASISGLVKKDEKEGIDVTYKYYILNNEYDGTDFVEIEANKYAPIASIKAVGKYIVVVARDEISVDGYTVSFDGFESALGFGSVDGLPYFAVEITPITIKISVQDASKIYSTTFTYNSVSENIKYTLLLDEDNLTAEQKAVYDDDKDNIIIGFTSLGFAASATVGKYSVVANCSGESADNYIFAVQESDTFEVKKYELQYTIANIVKEYGDAFDLTTISEYTLTKGAIFEGDEIESLVFACEGAPDSAAVNSAYAITATATGTRSENYGITIVGKMIVNKKALTINTITEASDLIYDATEKSVTVVFNGVYGTDEVIAIVTYNDDANIKPIAKGTYIARVTGISGAQANNYTYAVSEEADIEFEITIRDVVVNVDDIIMGYGDTKLSPTGTGYTLEGASLDFIASDIESGKLVLTFEIDAEHPDAMAGDCGDVIADCVIITISGDASENYTLTINSKGDLTINAKALTTLTLKNDKITYNGADLTNMVELDTLTTGLEKTMYEHKIGEDEWEEVTEVVNAGEYRVTVEVTENTNIEDEVGATTVLNFTVEKATWLVEQIDKAENISIYYNKIVFIGSFPGTIMVSVDGVYADEYEATDTLADLKDMKQYTFYVKIGESANYKESAIIEIKATTTFDPNKVNTALTTLGSSFGYKDIATYQTIIQNIAKVGDNDQSSIDSAKLNAAKARYELLMNAGSKAITITKQIAGTASKQTYQIATTVAISGAGLLIAGLSCFTLKKKKEDSEKEAE